jgi:prolipoprotein diacylglyceryltransferase
MLGAIPSPSSNSIEIGPLDLRLYGLMIAFGVFAAVWLAQKRWAALGNDPEDFAYVAIRAVPAGIIGARLYHVITDQRDLADWHKVWEGGLGIPLPSALDAAAPALPLAQAIGRLGNWFNQEVFGKPTDLPWGLEIDLENRPAGYAPYETFHPTFLYELLWNLGLCGFLLWLDSKRVVRRGYLIAVYVLGYGIGRLWIELLRIDEASEILGVRVNVWTSIFAIAVSLVVLLVAGLRRDGAPVTGDLAADDEPADDESAADDPEAEREEPAAPADDPFADLAAIPETDEVIVSTDEGFHTAVTDDPEGEDDPSLA